MSKPIRIAVLSLVPLLVVAILVAFRVEPVFSILQFGDQLSWFQQVLVVFVMLFLPLVGAFFTIKPAFSPAVRGQKNSYLLNCLLATTIIIFSVTITISLAQ